MIRTTCSPAQGTQPFGWRYLRHILPVQNGRYRECGIQDFSNPVCKGVRLLQADKVYNKLSKTERELGGIPNTSEDVKQSHASAIESYIEKHVGLDLEGTYRDKDDMGNMYFRKTLEDWAKFDISNRTKFDASISSGLAIMANQKHLYTPVEKKSKISINFARYNNKNSVSQLLNK